MTRKLRHIILLLLAMAISMVTNSAFAQTNLGLRPDSTRYVDGTRVYADTAIYQGMCIKYDLGSTILGLASAKGKIQTYEISMNWRLKQRFYPTAELGYARADVGAEGGNHLGQGGFVRLGVDINGLKKNRERLDAMLIGIRLATDVQQYSLSDVTCHDVYNLTNHMEYPNLIRADFWGEVVAGCQVQIYAGFTMGWALRIKILATRKDKNNGPLPYYIPGYGYRDDTNWGFNYYIGYRF